MNSNFNSSSNSNQEQCYYQNYDKFWMENNCNNRQTWNDCINFPCNEQKFDLANKKCCNMKENDLNNFNDQYKGCMNTCLYSEYTYNN